jgi:hypothetical protein
MDERLLSELPPWLTEAGLAGASEADIVIGFCDRCVAAGILLGRAHVFIDTPARRTDNAKVWFDETNRSSSVYRCAMD